MVDLKKSTPGLAGVDALLAAQVDVCVLQLFLSSVGWSSELSFDNKYCVIISYLLDNHNYL
jgi:hypothetical protein